MNKQRKKKLEQLQARLVDLTQELQAMADEEQEYFDNIPEPLQMSDRAMMAEEAIEAMNNALEELGNVSSSLSDAINV